MEKIILSSNNKEYTLVTNGANASTSSATFIVYPVEGETIEQTEGFFTGNDLIKMFEEDDEEKTSLRNFVGFTSVQSVSKIKDYTVGGMDEEGNDITDTVIEIVCIKPSIEAQVADLSTVVDDIIISLL